MMMTLHRQTSSSTHSRNLSGNRELNGELRAKADELEKLFTEHMQRVLGNQRDSMQRASMEGFQGCGQFESCRGEFYEIYMQKRDAKLRKERGSKIARNQVELRAMLEGIQITWDEMKARFGGYDDEEDSDLCVHSPRAEKLRSFSLRSIMRSIDEPTIESVHLEDEHPQESSPAHFYYSQDNLYNRNPVSHSKKILSCRSDRTSGAPIPRPSLRAPNSAYPMRSSARKENTKPNATERLINFARSKSTNAGTSPAINVKTQRSQSLRKSSVSPLNFDSSNLSRISKDESEPKPFLRKGSGTGPGAGAATGNYRAFMVSDKQENREECEGIAHQILAGHHRRCFSYSQELLDVDATVDSPTCSVAPWNSRPTSEVRTRKKWGPVQQPVLLANASEQKEAAKGIMKLMKFGRKSSNGAEKQVDDCSSPSMMYEVY